MVHPDFKPERVKRSDDPESGNRSLTIFVSIGALIGFALLCALSSYIHTSSRTPPDAGSPSDSAAR